MNTQAPAGSPVFAPMNSKSDRGFADLVKEVSAQRSVGAGCESLLQGIAQMVKDNDLTADNVDQILNRYSKSVCEAIVSHTAASVAQDTTRSGVEITAVKDYTDGNGDPIIERDPQDTPGVAPSENASKPLDLPEVEDDKASHKKKK
jgi:hypothetical protein